MQTTVLGLTGSHQLPPYFRDVRVDQQWAAESIRALHTSLTQDRCALELESCFIWTMAQLIKRYADLPFDEQRVGNERKAIQRARQHIDLHYAQGVSLTQLAEHVSRTPYYLLRVFRSEVGMPPDTYLESVRIRHAQRLIAEGKSLADVAVEVGFSSQSHLTNRFKRIIGVTPGQYAQQPG
jgi:AraC-like DNA-binding protein